MSPLQDSVGGNIIIRGQSRLLEDVKALEDLERARQLLASLEEQETMMRLLGPPETPTACKSISARKTRCSAIPAGRW